MPIRRIPSVLFAAAALCLAACKGPTASDKTSTPAVSFRYGGVRSGTFQLAAARPADARQGPYVDGTTPGFNAFFLTGVTGPRNDRVDHVTVNGMQAPGSYDLAQCGVVAVCALVQGSFGAGSSDPLGQGAAEGQVNWYLSQGTFTVLPADADGWVRGTFSGSGPASEFTGGQWRPLGIITVDNGRFHSDLVFRELCCS